MGLERAALPSIESVTVENENMLQVCRCNLSESLNLEI